MTRPENDANIKRFLNTHSDFLLTSQCDLISRVFAFKSVLQTDIENDCR